MTTSTNHPTPELLSDEQVAKIEARPSVKTEQWCLHRVLITESERDALCATLQAAWAESERLTAQLTLAQGGIEKFSTLADERHDLLSAERRANDDLRAERAKMLQSLERAQQERNRLSNNYTALREQLAQADETNRLAGLQIVELESRLAQVEKERDIDFLLSELQAEHALGIMRKRDARIG